MTSGFQCGGFQCGGFQCGGFQCGGFRCGGCGEWNETTIDPSAGMKQRYVEDCQVCFHPNKPNEGWLGAPCCKPNLLRIAWDKSENAYVISAELE